MVTLEQIQQAHSKVKSGVDFPAYIQELKSLGVTYYETHVSDGHTDFSGNNNNLITWPAKYDRRPIADTCKPDQFKAALEAHQQGATDYPTFIGISAALGIEKWAVAIEQLTCTYYDKAGNEMLVEAIPG